ncbi:MAG: hypothetical protein ACR2FF_05035 [Mycobacteriales bacterium]
MNVLQPSIDAEVAYRRERVAAEFPSRSRRGHRVRRRGSAPASAGAARRDPLAS